MRSIWYIHGAFATPRSFTWLKDQLPSHEEAFIEYSCTERIATVLDEIEAEINELDAPIDIIGHSLGGVMGVCLARRCQNVRRVVTLGSPFGGSRLAIFLQFLTVGTFMREVQPASPIMLEVRDGPTPVPVLSIITTGGHSLMIAEPNDGVVTRASQIVLEGPTYVERPVSHFEVLLDDETPRLIEDFLWNG